MISGWRKKQIMIEEQRSQVEEMLRYEIDALEEKLAECRAQRKWRGLTDEEVKKLRYQADEEDSGYTRLIKATEAKLKEKNGYA